MKPSSMPMLELSLDPPCAEHREGLEELVSGPRAALTSRARRSTRHASTCSRCRRFVASLRSESRAVRSAFMRWERGAARRQPAVNGFERWLEQHLERVDARIGARACWRAARALLVADPTYESAVVLDAPGCVESIWIEASRPLAAVLPRWAGRELPAPIEHATLPARVGLARRLLAFGDECARGGFSDLHLTRASIDWIYGDASRVPDHLERAVATARTLWARAEAIGNLAVWAMDEGNVVEALRLNRLALLTEPAKGSVWLNELVWRTVRGESRKAAQSLAALTPAGEPLARGLRPALVNARSSLRATAQRMGVPMRVAADRARQWIPWWGERGEDDERGD